MAGFKDIAKDLTSELENVSKVADKASESLEKVADSSIDVQEELSKIRKSSGSKVSFFEDEFIDKKTQAPRSYVSVLSGQLKNVFDRGGDRTITSPVSGAELAKIFKMGRETWDKKDSQEVIQNLLLKIAARESSRYKEETIEQVDSKGEKTYRSVVSGEENEAIRFLESFFSKIDISELPSKTAQIIIKEVMTSAALKKQEVQDRLDTRNSQSTETRESSNARKGKIRAGTKFQEDQSDYYGREQDIQRVIDENRSYRPKNKTSFSNMTTDKLFGSGEEKLQNKISRTTTSEVGKIQDAVVSDIKNILRFSVMAPVLDSIPGASELIKGNEENSLIMSNMRDYSKVISSVLGEDFLSQKENVSEDKKGQMIKNFPEILKELADQTQKFIDDDAASGSSTLDEKVITQLRNRIISLGKISAYYKHTLARESILDTDDAETRMGKEVFNKGQEDAQQRVLDTFFEETNDFNRTWTDEAGKIYTKKYRGSAFRNIMGKQGIKTEGLMPVSSIPQYAVESLPYFPNKDLVVSPATSEGYPVVPKNMEGTNVSNINAFAENLIKKIKSIGSIEEERTDEQKELSSYYEDILTKLYNALDFTPEARKKMDKLETLGKKRTLTEDESKKLKSLREWRFTSETRKGELSQLLEDNDFFITSDEGIKYRYNFDEGQLPYENIIKNITDSKTQKTRPQIIKDIKTLKNLLKKESRQKLYGEKAPNNGDESYFSYDSREIAQISDLIENLEGGRSFTEDEIDQYFEPISQGESPNRLLPLGTDSVLPDALQYDKKGYLKLDSLKKRLEELSAGIVGEIDDAVSLSVNDNVDALIKAIQELEDEITSRDLNSYIKQHQEAKTTHEKAEITKKFKNHFNESKEDELYKNFVKMRSSKKNNPIVSSDIDQATAKNAVQNQVPFIIGTEEDFLSKKKGVYHVRKGESAGIVSSLDQIYQNEGKTYSGKGIQIDGKIGFLDDWGKNYSQLDVGGKNNLIKSLMEVFNKASTYDQSWLVAEIKRVASKKTGSLDLWEDFKKANKDNKSFAEALSASNKLKWDNQTYSFIPIEEKKIDNIIPMANSDHNEKNISVEKMGIEPTNAEVKEPILSQENQDFAKTNETLKNHNALLQEAIDKEKEKAIVSQQLSKQLEKERSAIQEVNADVENHAEITTKDSSVVQNNVRAIEQIAQASKKTNITSEDVKNASFVPTNFFEIGHSYRKITTPQDQLEYNKKEKKWYVKGTGAEPEYEKDEAGRYVSYPSSTAIVGSVLGGHGNYSLLSEFGKTFGGKSGSDLGALQEEFKNRYNKTEADDIRSGLVYTGRGTIAHKAIELIEKQNEENKDVGNVISKISELNEEHRAELEKTIANVQKELQITGMSDNDIQTKLNVDNRVRTNMALGSLMGTTGTKMSELPLAAKVGDFTFAGTFDKIFGSIFDEQEGLILADMKNTDKLSEDTASYQVALQQVLLNAAKEFILKIFDVDVGNIEKSGIFQLGDKTNGRFVPVSSPSYDVIAKLFNSFLQGTPFSNFPNLIDRSGIINVPSGGRGNGRDGNGGGGQPLSSNGTSDGNRFLTSSEMLGTPETLKKALLTEKSNAQIKEYGKSLSQELDAVEKIYSIKTQIERLEGKQGETAKEQRTLLENKLEAQNNLIKALDKERTLIENAYKEGKLTSAQMELVDSFNEAYRNKVETARMSGVEAGTQASIKTGDLTFASAKKEYLKSEKQRLEYKERITRLDTLLSDQTINGETKRGMEDTREKYNSLYKNFISNPATELNLGNLTPDENGRYKIQWYDEATRGMKEYYATAQEVQQLENENTLLTGKAMVKISQAATPTQKSLGLFKSILTGFKASFRNLTDYSLAYAIIGKIKQGIAQVIQKTKELDKVMVDLQIVTGDNRKEAKNLLGTYNKLASEIGRSTTSIASASNDWLRAGYEGKEAAKLTKASMYLSTLGMEDGTQATTQLISSLKGWKLEAGDVMSVVDKLTVTICGVCTVMCIGHKTNCR